MISIAHGLDALSQKNVPDVPGCTGGFTFGFPKSWSLVCETIGLAPEMSGSYSVGMARIVWLDVTVPY